MPPAGIVPVLDEVEDGGARLVGIAEAPALHQMTPRERVASYRAIAGETNADSVIVVLSTGQQADTNFWVPFERTKAKYKACLYIYAACSDQVIWEEDGEVVADYGG